MGSFRILKKAWDFFSKWYYFHNLLNEISFQINISSIFFQYSERTIDSTETNNTSAESSWSQLFGARRKRAWHDQEGATPIFRRRTLKKSKFDGANSGCKKNFFNSIFNMLMLWANCMPIAFEFQQCLFYILSNCQT